MMSIWDYGNPHISLSGTLEFLRTASEAEVEVYAEAEGYFDRPRIPIRLDIHIDDNSSLIGRKTESPTIEEIHQAYKAFLTDFESSPSIEGSFVEPHFDKFLDTITQDKRFVKRLPKKLGDLNKWRNIATHQHHWEYPAFEYQIKKTYAEFMGIGHSGILPRLMRLHPKVQQATRR